MANADSAHRRRSRKNVQKKCLHWTAILYNLNFLVSLLPKSLQTLLMDELLLKVSWFLNPMLWNEEVEKLRDVLEDLRKNIGAISIGEKVIKYLDRDQYTSSTNMDTASFMINFSYHIMNCMSTMLDVQWISTATT